MGFHWIKHLWLGRPVLHWGRPGGTGRCSSTRSRTSSSASRRRCCGSRRRSRCGAWRRRWYRSGTWGMCNYWILTTSSPEVPGKDSLENVLVKIAGGQGASLTRVYEHTMGVGQPPKIGIGNVSNQFSDRQKVKTWNEWEQWSYLMTAWETLWATSKIDLASFPFLSLLSSTKPPTSVPAESFKDTNCWSWVNIALWTINRILIKDQRYLIPSYISAIFTQQHINRVTWIAMQCFVQRLSPAVYVHVRLWFALHVVKFTSSYTCHIHSFQNLWVLYRLFSTRRHQRHNKNCSTAKLSST